MLEYERIDVSDGIDVGMSDKSKELCFVIIGIFYMRTLIMDHIFVMDAII